ncbi:2443_t:CDS:2 [Dentiscutata heterogama]|uniref:2443_t:CDS:1 n=1 Tax=Dentiscutata heterogama TaxID=1316150 RepID=A0ACA9KMJ7_9GLOM|nr:2443_t:CDS:2 [Dentiscutata heterogama]
MENEIHEELTNYLSIILEELCVEKNQETNVIDNLIRNQSQAGCIKKCSVCNTSNIDNKKRVCPTCRNRLPTITEINQQLDESANIVNTNEKSLVINSYTFRESRYSENEAHEPRVRPSYISESRRFRAQIRKSQFVNPNVDNRIFQNISGEWTLSEEMKRFSEIACSKRIEFIEAKLIKKISLGIWHPVPITCEEADLQKTDSSLTRPQILSIINSLIPLLGDADRSRFRGLSNKSRDNLMIILQEIRNILADNGVSTNNEV